MFTRLDIFALLAAAAAVAALQPPKAVGKAGTSLKFDAADAMADMMKDERCERLAGHL